MRRILRPWVHGSHGTQRRLAPQGTQDRFRYYDSRGKRITDADKLARIEELVIPPAWMDVRISPRTTAKVQATGIDRAGRLQYLYHAEFRAQQEQEKFDRLVLFGERLPDLRKTMSEHMDSEPVFPEWVCASRSG
jgi:DNA topoisomerase-1